MIRAGYWILLLLIVIGFSDSAFLTYEHYALTSIGCPVSPWINCLAVASSQYSEIFGIPLALLGMFYYGFMFIFLTGKSKMFNQFFLLTSGIGVLFSLYLIYVQAFLIGLFCLYCLLSALVSFTIFGFSMWYFRGERNGFLIDIIFYFYKFIIKPILFLIDPEVVHVNMVLFGERIFKIKFIKNISRGVCVRRYPKLKQRLLEINFSTPIGLAAGFDYEARLTQTLPFLGFGFGSVGTVTNLAYEGNTAPRLGRLPRSRSLMVNKGFKSLGAKVISEKLSKLKFLYPVGVSIGRTNSASLNTVDDSIKDIISALNKFEKEKVNLGYYELNISCPNLKNSNLVDFYKIPNLKKLLGKVNKINTKKPILIKMPIDQADRHVKMMLNEIVKYRKIKGVIFGNLQTNKKEKSFDKSEVGKFKVGKFSGKPTEVRSNELIKLAYKNYKGKLLIIGCGGVFNAKDAWKKFENGASLVQLITGMIFEGPQLVAQINRDLNEMLKEKDYSNIAQMIGSGVN